MNCEDNSSKVLIWQVNITNKKNNNKKKLFQINY